MVEQIKRVRLNNTRIEHLVEQLYELNRRLVADEGRLLRLAESVGVKRRNSSSSITATSSPATGWSASRCCPAAAGPGSSSGTPPKS